MSSIPPEYEARLRAAEYEGKTRKPTQPTYFLSSFLISIHFIYFFISHSGIPLSHSGIPLGSRGQAGSPVAEQTILISLLYSPVRDNLVIIENYYHQSSGRMRGIMTWLLTSILLALMRKSNKYRVIVMSNAEPTL